MTAPVRWLERLSSRRLPERYELAKPDWGKRVGPFPTSWFLRLIRFYPNAQFLATRRVVNWEFGPFTSWSDTKIFLENLWSNGPGCPTGEPGNDCGSNRMGVNPY